MRKGFTMMLMICQFFLVQHTKAQLHSAMGSSGGEYEGKDYRLSFTIGEAAIQTLESTNYILTQGFQQPQLWVTSIDGFTELKNNIQIYPNPAIEYLVISTDKALPGQAICRLYDMNGQLKHKSFLDGTNTTIDLQGLAPAPYFMKISYKGNTLKTTKIIKQSI